MDAACFAARINRTSAIGDWWRNISRSIGEMLKSSTLDEHFPLLRMIPFCMAEALLSTDLGSLPLPARGKVRDIYAVSDEPGADLVFIATDRISAFDHVLGSGIPDKGRILTRAAISVLNSAKTSVVLPC